MRIQHERLEISSASAARGFAKALFLRNHPNQTEFFDAVWPLLSRSRSVLCRQGLSGYLSRMPVSARVAPAARAMAKEVAVLVVAFLEKLPIIAEELVPLLESSGRKIGVPPRTIRKLETGLKALLEPERTFVFWKWEPSAGRKPKNGEIAAEAPHKGYWSRAEVEQHHQCIKDYDIFISGASVWIRRKGVHRRIELDRRVRLLLIMLIRYRGEELPTVPLYRKAWSAYRQYEGSDDKHVTEHFLKPAISQLRRELQRVLPSFKIPRKTWDSGYKCQGQFSFCIILPRNQEREVSLVW